MRFFVTRVDAYEVGIVKATGHSYVRDMMRGGVIEKQEQRIKILLLSSGTLIVYQLPDHVTIDLIKFVTTDGQLSLTDGKKFTMYLSESTHGGRV